MGPRSRARVLEVGIGRGRNTAALRESGFDVTGIDDDLGLLPFALGELRDRDFDGALSTHALLHGTHRAVGKTLAQIARALKIGAPFYAVIGSIHDTRCGKGRKIAEGVYAAEEGDEAGVLHAYFSQEELREMLLPLFEIESLEEKPTGSIVGRWAHLNDTAGFVHWFVRARARG